ncbi:histidine kinase N-terminal 7TM domain-containing protein [Haloarchaeobius sp. TZWSO28]|uniref:histidine kinase N-terminal 7TM domain-containing protein n=1 Tax=Haloarchaeobius sp. TZWSO28 TaxID=3446119 RepID=UPI003EBAD225
MGWYEGAYPTRGVLRPVGSLLTGTDEALGWQPTPWADPLRLATVVSLSLALYAAVYVGTVRRDRGVVARFTLMFGTAVWSLGYSFQFASDDLAGKLLWHAVPVVGLAATLVGGSDRTEQAGVPDSSVEE